MRKFSDTDTDISAGDSIKIETNVFFNRGNIRAKTVDITSSSQFIALPVSLPGVFLSKYEFTPPDRRVGFLVNSGFIGADKIFLTAEKFLANEGRIAAKDHFKLASGLDFINRGEVVQLAPYSDISSRIASNSNIINEEGVLSFEGGPFNSEMQLG